MPSPLKPEKYAEYAGPPSFLCDDYAMFLMSPLFGALMGMEPSTIYGMLPIEERKQGVMLDAAITNPDMARNFDLYEIENLQAPVLILHSKDDKMASYEAVTEVLDRFQSCKFVSFEKGGHLMKGNGEKVKEEVLKFLRE